MLNPTYALLVWPLVAIWLFARLPFERAIIWSVVGSYLFLPSSFAIDLPGLPPMDKQSLPNLMLLVIVPFLAPRRFRILPPGRLAKALLGLLVVGAVLTVWTNTDSILAGDRVLRGLAPYDALSHSGRQLLLIVPFLVAAQYLASAEAHREILKVFLVAGLAYSLLMLFEVRMSPQLHRLVYGYFPHSFAQQARWGGFRPVVFLQHGLWVAFFAMTITVAAAALWRDAKARSSGRAGQPGANPKGYLYATGYLAVVVVSCKSLASMLYTAVLLPIVLMLRTRTQVLIASVMVLVALTYPALRGADLVPTGTLLEWAEAIGPQRADSLRFRFDNEDLLLDHASTRPLFGWGLWGRNRVFDQETGADLSTTDGYWIIIIGVSGWAGYMAIFGLLSLPVLLMLRHMHRARHVEVPIVTAALALLLGINMIELLPNATITPLTWLVAGSLLGHAARKDIRVADAVAPAPPPAARTVL